MTILYTVLILILVVALSDIIRRVLPFKAPLPLIQILLGGLIAWPDLGFHVDFDPELFLILFIPPLLFSDGRKMPLHEFMHQRREVLSLAMTLVFITVVGLGYLIHYIIPDMPLVVAFALAAVLSPTDAVALSGIVGKGRLPKKMMSILEGEALMNDASALVSLKFAVAIAIGAMAFESFHDYTTLGITFIKMAIGGIVMGMGVTWFYIKLVRVFSGMRDDNPATQMIFFLLLPFVAYAVAEHLQTSGILAAVASGMMVGHSNVINSAPITMRLRANSVWLFLEFILNGTVFLMLGLQIPGIIETSMEHIETDNNMTLFMLVADIFWIYFALMFVRFLWLMIMKYFSKVFFKKRPLYFEQLNHKELLLMTFSGVRGAVTLAAALSIPLVISILPYVPFPSRYQIVFLSVGVILCSLIVGVLLLPLLLRGFSIDFSELAKEKKLARAAMSKAALASLETLENRLLVNMEGDMDPQVIKGIHAQIATDMQRQTRQHAEVESYEPIERRFRLAALRAERGELYHLQATNAISEETINKLLYEIDLLETVLIGREKES